MAIHYLNSRRESNSPATNNQSTFFVTLKFPINLDAPPVIYPNAPTDEIETRVMRFLTRRLTMPMDGKR
jgi:hypothetical protein